MVPGAAQPQPLVFTLRRDHCHGRVFQPTNCAFRAESWELSPVFVCTGTTIVSRELVALRIVHEAGWRTYATAGTAPARSARP